MKSKLAAQLIAAGSREREVTFISTGSSGGSSLSFHPALVLSGYPYFGWIEKINFTLELMSFDITEEKQPAALQ